jgi:hypothetical protein
MIISYQLHVKVNTPVGVFTGFASGELPTMDDVIEERNKLQEALRSYDLFTFHSDDNPGTEISLTGLVIPHSVFEFTIIHKTD